MQRLVLFADPGPPPQISINDVTLTEGNSGTKTATFTVSLSAPGGEVTVKYATAHGTADAADYVHASGTLTFPMGTTSKTVTVTVNGDTTAEFNETFLVNLTDPTNATFADAQGQGTITNDDNPLAPANVVATADGTTSVTVNWTAAPGATSYRVYRGVRSGGGITYTLAGTPSAPALTDAGVSANTAYLYKVRSFATVESGDSNLDLATTIAFTDPALVAGTTKAKLAHFTELLTAVNAVRTLAGLTAITFTAPTPDTSVTIRRQHLLDLRTGIDAARSTLTLPAVTYTDPTITAGATTIKAAHITEVRSGVQ